LDSEVLAGLVVTSGSSHGRASVSYEQVSVLSVALTSPANETTASLTEPMMLRAQVQAYGNQVRQVNFYDGEIKIGEARTEPFTLQWTNALAGQHTLRAVAVDEDGASMASAPSMVHRTMPATRLTVRDDNKLARGIWKPRFGAVGAVIVGDSTNLSSSVVLTADAQTTIWAKKTVAKNALRRAEKKGRVAAAWTSTTNFTVHLEFNDGALHELSLYFVDHKNARRVQLVEIFDAETGETLGSRTVTNFSKGLYLTYWVRGTIDIRVTKVSGPNAVMSGLFVDRENNKAPSIAIETPSHHQSVIVGRPASITTRVSDNDGTIEQVEFFVNGTKSDEATEAPFTTQWFPTAPGEYTLAVRATDNLGEVRDSTAVIVTAELPESKAELIRIDAGTQGAWIGRYGSDGFAIATYRTNIPPYASFELDGASIFGYWPEVRARELQRFEGGDGILAVWFRGQLTADLKLVDGLEHQFATYFVDPERSRSQRMELIDGATDEVLFTDDLIHFGEGVYYVWKARGHLKLRLTSLFGPSTILSGVFLDPLTIDPDPLPLQPAITSAMVNGMFHVSVWNDKDGTTSLDLEISEDLVNWRSAEDELERVEIVDLGPEERIVFKLRLPTANQTHSFIRLRPSAN
ncbi:MAG TPA: Ig-like domain-containing protein, partial [Candidatus Acidoferrum sp.]|nr:Ig-like domain-containing protein [Candidatus Acidoferrum sp.]